MAVAGPKSAAPIEQAILSPINESVTFTPGNTIIFRISASDMRYWLVQDSYFVFDVDWTFPATPNRDLVIRNSSTFFTDVRIVHGGNEVYYSQYNIAQQFLDYLKTGDDFLAANYNEWTSHKTYNSSLTDGANYPLIIHTNEVDADHLLITKRGIIMHVSQIMKCFAQCENFPLKNCSQPIEFRFHIAQPNEFLLASDRSVSGGSVLGGNNFYDIGGNNSAANGQSSASGSTSQTEAPLTNGPTSFEIKNMKLYMFGAQVQDSYASVIDASNASGQGMMWEFTMPRINLRNEPDLSVGYHISNFTCITENVDKLYVWVVRRNNLGATLRPHVINMNLRFGAHQLPKSPTAEDNWTKPALYKALTDDTLEYDTAYYTSANSDYSRCYYALATTAIALSNSTSACTPHDAHLLMAASFTTDDQHPGAPSKMWNSQYNLHYQIVHPEAKCVFVLAVDTQYVLSLRSGMLSSTNI